MAQKNTQGTWSAHIEFWMHLNSLFNKFRRAVILIPTILCQDELYIKIKHKNLTDQCLKVFIINQLEIKQEKFWCDFWWRETSFFNL